MYSSGVYLGGKAIIIDHYTYILFVFLFIQDTHAKNYFLVELHVVLTYNARAVWQIPTSKLHNRSVSYARYMHNNKAIGTYNRILVVNTFNFNFSMTGFVIYWTIVHALSVFWTVYFDDHAVVLFCCLHYYNTSSLIRYFAHMLVYVLCGS